MNHNLDKIEENLKQKSGQRKKRKISGRSVFKLQEIIKKKSEEKSKENLSQKSNS